MSLTATDLEQIRGVVREEVNSSVAPRFADLNREVGGLSRRIDLLTEKVDKFDGRITANENDIKDIYGLLDQKAGKSGAVTA
jgi:hypothetical protein